MNNAQHDITTSEQPSVEVGNGDDSNVNRDVDDPGVAPVRIDPSLHEGIPARNDVQKEQLRRQLLADPHTRTFVVWRGRNALVDDAEKHQECLDLGLTPSYTEEDFDDEERARSAIILRLVDRPHLNDWQRARLGLDLKWVYAELAGAQKGTRNDLRVNSPKRFRSIDSLEEAAGVVGFKHK